MPVEPGSSLSEINGFFSSSFHLQIPSFPSPFTVRSISFFCGTGPDRTGWGGWGVLREWELHCLGCSWADNSYSNFVSSFISLFSHLVNLLEVLLHISCCFIYKCFFFFQYGSKLK